MVVIHSIQLLDFSFYTMLTFACVNIRHLGLSVLSTSGIPFYSFIHCASNEHLLLAPASSLYSSLNILIYDFCESLTMIYTQGGLSVP